MLYIEEIENPFAISITAEFLTDITNQLERYFNNISYIATLKNKDTRVFDSINTICNYENALEKRIVKLEIIANNDQNESTFLFLVKKKTTSIHGTISTNDAKQTKNIYEKLDYIIRRHNEGAFYSYIATQDFWEFVEKVVLLCIFFFTFDGTTAKEENSIIFLLTNYFIPTLEISLVFLALLYGLFRILQYFFPIIIFEIGDEIKRNSKRLGFKKNIIWAIFVAIFASVVGSFIYAGLTK